MTIRARAYATLGGLAALILVLALGGVWAVQSSQTLVNRLHNGALLPALDLKIMSDGYTRAGIVTAVRVRTGDLGWEEGEQAVRAVRARLTPAWADYVSRAGGETGSDAERGLIVEATARMADADAALDELADILAGQDVAGLTTYIARVMYPSINPLLSVIETLTARQDRDGQDIYAASTEAIRGEERALAALLIVAALVFLAAVSTIRYRVVRPLVGMTRAMSAVAGGDLERAVPSTERRDEIGALAQALARFRKNALQLKRLTVELEEARDKAEEATRAKSSFLAMMSHEIRTPMNGVMSMAELLDQTPLTEDQRGMSGVIRQSAAALLTIINDILDFSKIEAGRLEIERVPFSLAEVVEGTAELIGARAEDRGLELVVDADPALPDRLEGDPTRIRQILLNLLGNAVKFTESGGVTLSVARTGERLRFAVTDTGIGLTEEQRGRLFQAFVQADSSTARKYGGTGLGLSICQRLCAMMGGAIGVDSVAGEGSTFWFELPLVALDPAPLAPEVAINDAAVRLEGFPPGQGAAVARMLTAAGISQDSGGPGVTLVYADRRPLPAGDAGPAVLVASRTVVGGLSPAERAGFASVLTLPPRRLRLWRAIGVALGRIDADRRTESDDPMAWAPPSVDEARAAAALVLVAEDNPTNQVVIRRLLGRLGYAHEIAGNGVEALVMLKQGGHGLLLTDFHMPEMDGFELTAAIRTAEESGGAPRLPIVALTADALPGTEQHCLDGGMDGYLTKPIDSKALAATLERWLPRAAALRRRPEPEPVVETPPPAPPEIDPAIFDAGRLAESFGSLGGALGPEARGFLGGFLEGLPAMLAAVDEALGRDDGPAARDAAHALKGAARSIGAVRLGQVAADVQDCLDAGDLDTARLMASLLEPTRAELAGATATLL